MQMRKLGKSGLEVSAIGFGCAAAVDRGDEYAARIAADPMPVGTLDPRSSLSNCSSGVSFA